MRQEFRIIECIREKDQPSNVKVYRVWVSDAFTITDVSRMLMAKGAICCEQTLETTGIWLVTATYPGIEKTVIERLRKFTEQLESEFGQ